MLLSRMYRVMLRACHSLSESDGILQSELRHQTSVSNPPHPRSHLLTWSIQSRAQHKVDLSSIRGYLSRPEWIRYKLTRTESRSELCQYSVHFHVQRKTQKHSFFIFLILGKEKMSHLYPRNKATRWSSKTKPKKPPTATSSTCKVSCRVM